MRYMLPSEKVKKCFDTFFCKLGSKYEDLMNHPNTDIYGRIRCGLIHEYIIRANSRIVIEGGDCGIVYNDKSKTYTFVLDDI
jgi:hypothetical protein